MEHQSVYFLAHHMRYKDNKTIKDIQKLDEDMVETYITNNTSGSYKDVYTYINKDYIDNKNKRTVQNSVAYKILHVAYKLRFAFEAIVRQKDVCFLQVKHNHNNTNNTIKNSHLSPNQQFNLYLYIFNENSSVKIVNNHQYKSAFRHIINITLDVMKNY